MPSLYRYPFLAMGSRCEIRLYAANEERAAGAARAAIADVRRLEEKYSRYRDESVTAQINRVAAAGGATQVDDETATLLDYAATCYEQSDGLFDLTSGVLRAVWGAQCRALPDEETLTRILARVGWGKVSWQRPCLAFGTAGMELDFGGVVKEYAADRAAVLCAQAGLRHGLVDLGGDIKIIGPHPDASPWSIGIQHPRIANAVMATLELSYGAVATSGDYERFLEIDGKRYCHILSPRTGMPVRGLAGVSVAAEECVVAGSATTIAMLMEDRGVTWLQEVGLPHVWMDQGLGIGGTYAANACGVARQSVATARAQNGVGEP
ncbi:MAG TPA: FAD:protein FMN transferase [Casimicrobiaceae bacterium]|jgi:thiamine biosynthesis lipoprotein|nr:FAD:protein FMN transferase [Casimicrobiaceae bacterium]